MNEVVYIKLSCLKSFTIFNFGPTTPPPPPTQPRCRPGRCAGHTGRGQKWVSDRLTLGRRRWKHDARGWPGSLNWTNHPHQETQCVLWPMMPWAVRLCSLMLMYGSKEEEKLMLMSMGTGQCYGLVCLKLMARWREGNDQRNDLLVMDRYLWSGAMYCSTVQ
jgi:hypothetical protein